MTTMPSLNMLRARHAYAAVKTVTGAQLVDYKRAARQMPARVLTNGIGQALAMLMRDGADQAKPDEASKLLRSHLTRWLTDGAIPHPFRLAVGEALIEQLIAGDQELFVWMQRETLAYLGWLKIFAEAGISAGEGGADEGK
ncbi:type III-B CRISPR module-associated protein Cmr5 (plasmid) [Tistrella mobilis]|uniref:type III-B CRISPR module-associated protein Cmr5 n=1 Tax=Tistrella mobilis TaxID=171437 RepID=UPI0035592B79